MNKPKRWKLLHLFDKDGKPYRSIKDWIKYGENRGIAKMEAYHNWVMGALAKDIETYNAVLTKAIEKRIKKDE